MPVKVSVPELERLLALRDEIDALPLADIVWVAADGTESAAHPDVVAYWRRFGGCTATSLLRRGLVGRPLTDADVEEIGGIDAETDVFDSLRD